MDREKMIANLAAAGPLDKETLTKLNECQLRALLGANEKPEDPKPEDKKVETPAANTEIKAVEDLLKTVQNEIANLRAVVQPTVDAQKREKDGLISALVANKRCVFEKAELEAMDVPALQKLHTSIRGVSYAGQGGPKVEVALQEEMYAEPVPYYVTNAKKEN